MDDNFLAAILEISKECNSCVLIIIRDFIVFNPVTGETVEISDPENNIVVDSYYTFGYNRKNDDYVILMVY
ncbi:uncharacterized protein G2W53_041324 [Senna tora]|uniref:Uncharacterized protein n=1 Tax=Senna tora TaxID=362788 RepID=A0A834SH79_9FABA|nr:uncharacterized protein G2W53_041324 [Senna tora]